MDATLVGQSIICPVGYGYRKRECESVASWFVENYLPRHKLNIEIVHRGLKRDCVYGYCSTEDPCSRQRNFLIELDTYMESDLYIQTLLHELWHMYQHVKGKLKDSRGKRFWKGVDHTNTDYEDQPWEVEARQMEEYLWDCYLRDTNKKPRIRFFPNRLTTRN